MLLRRDALEAIVAGTIDAQYRLWRKPTVNAGGRLRTVLGELTILSVEQIEPSSITEADAARAGVATADEARASLLPRPIKAGTNAATKTEGLVTEASASTRGRTAQPDETSRPYRIVVRFEGVDSRLALREDVSADAMTAVTARLAGIDARSIRGAWTARTLGLIATWPGRRAPELAEMEGLETLPFKNDVRKLKELGLTVSLTVGYELSTRGHAVLAAVNVPAAAKVPAKSRSKRPAERPKLVK